MANIVKAQMNIETNDVDELRRILDHHIDYIINMDDCSDIISSIANVQSYDITDKRDATKLSMLASLLEDILGENEPSDEDLDIDDNAIELYDNLYNIKTSLQAMGIM